MHIAPKGSPNLDGRILGVVSRISYEGVRVLATATHSIDMAKSSQATGQEVYLRVTTGRNSFDYLLPPIEIYSTSPAQFHAGLDLTLFEMDDGLAANMGMKTLRFNPRLSKLDVVQVYTPQIDGTWKSSMGTVVRAVGPFRFLHSASTDYGASGSPIIKNNTVVGFHTSRVPEKGCNLGASPLKMFPSPSNVHESSEEDRKDKLWEEEEPDYGDDYDDGNQYSDYEYDDFEVDDYVDIQEYQDRMRTRIYGKSGHRDFRAATRSFYTEEEKEQNWMQHHGYETAVPSQAVPSPGTNKSNPALEPSAQAEPAPEPPSALAQAKAVLKSTPPVSLNETGQGGAKIPSSKKQGNTGGSEEKNKSQPVLDGQSSAQPSAPSPQRDGGRKRKRRRKRKPKSPDLKTGTQPTAPAEQPMKALISSLAAELKELRQQVQSSNQ